MIGLEVWCLADEVEAMCSSWLSKSVVSVAPIVSTAVPLRHEAVSLVTSLVFESLLEQFTSIAAANDPLWFSDGDAVVATSIICSLEFDVVARFIKRPRTISSILFLIESYTNRR